MFEKSYLIKAFYQWASDNNHKIEILLWAKHPSFNSTQPQQFLEIDEEDFLLLNISKGCVHTEIGKDAIEFSFVFRGEDYKISADIEAIYWLRAKEVGEYLRLDGVKKPYIKGVFTNLREKAKRKKEIKNRRIGMAPEDIEKWVRENKDKYTSMLHINDWHITYKIIKQNDPVSIKNEELHTNEGGRSADCSTIYRYSSATIRLFAAQIHSVESLRRILIHELAHVAAASFDLYRRFFEEGGKLFDSEKRIAKKLASDINELLAVKMETIIAGQQEDFIGIYAKASESDEKFRSDCYEYGVADKPVIIFDINKEKKKDAYEILDEEKKYDSKFWYEKWQKAIENSKERENLNKTESEKEKQKEKERDKTIDSYEKHKKEIILPVDFKNTEDRDTMKYDWKKIIVPTFIGGMKEEGNVNNSNNANQ
jgi:stringent starvation protein B